MANKIFLVFLVLNTFFLLPILAQKQRIDYQFWPGSTLKINLKKGWEPSFQYRARFIENAKTYQGSYFFATLNKKINKHFEGIFNYRLSFVVNKGTYHRFALGINANQKFGKTSLTLRPYLQYQKQFFIGDNEGSTATSTYFRPRFTVKESISKKFDAYVYAEPFINLKNNNHIDWWQNSAGVKWEYAKNKELNLYYIWQPDYSKKKFWTYHIFGLSLDFTIKPKSNKKSIQ